MRREDDIGGLGCIIRAVQPKERINPLQRAVQELQGTYNVAVVGADNKVETRVVKLGERVDALWVVNEGLSAGERVVVEGLQKIRPGVQVEPELVGADTAAAPPAGAPGT